MKLLRGGLVAGLVLVFALTMILPSNTYALSVKNKQGQNGQIKAGAAATAAAKNNTGDGVKTGKNAGAAMQNLQTTGQTQGLTTTSDNGGQDQNISQTSGALATPASEGAHTAGFSTPPPPEPLIPFDMPAPTEPGSTQSLVAAVGNYGTTLQIALGFDRVESNYGKERIWKCQSGQECQLKYSSDNNVAYDGGPYKVIIQDLNHIWAFSGYGKILFSSDAGETWVVQKQASPTHDGWDEISAIQEIGSGIYIMDFNGKIYKFDGNIWAQIANVQGLADLDANYWGAAVSMLPDPADTTGNLNWILYKEFTKDTRVWSSHLATFNITNNALTEISFPDPALEDIFVEGNCRSITTGTGSDYTIISCEPAEFDSVSFLVRNPSGEWVHVVSPNEGGPLNPRNLTPSPFESNIFYMMPGRGFTFYQYDAASETFTNIPVEYINDETPYVMNVIPRRGEIVICAWGGTNQFGKIMGAEAPLLSYKNVESEYHAGDVIDIDLVMDASTRDDWYVNVVRLMQIDGTDTYYSIPSGSDTEIDLTPFYIPDNDSVETNFFGAPLQLPTGSSFSSGTGITIYAGMVNPGKSVAEITPNDLIGDVVTAHFTLQ